jgi:hypothetical protein
LEKGQQNQENKTKLERLKELLSKEQADRGCAAVAFFGGSEGGVLKKRL